jgi:hypothetical protein
MAVGFSALITGRALLPKNIFCIPGAHFREPHGANRQQAIAKTHAKRSAYQIVSAFVLKNGVFWDVTPCGYSKNRCFGGAYRLLHQGDKDR